MCSYALVTCGDAATIVRNEQVAGADSRLHHHVLCVVSVCFYVLCVPYNVRNEQVAGADSRLHQQVLCVVCAYVLCVPVC